jgi:DNA-binding SARP family transcriptional activator/tetratricopeptide (TPR) repeat protein
LGELKILLLGTPEVFWDGRPVEIRRRIPRKILYYLAAHEYPIGRAEFLPLFWPELDETSARADLRDNLSKLRVALPDPSLLITDITKISLDYDRLNVDLLEFQKIIDISGRTPWQTPIDKPLPAELYKELSRAANLWRSPHFMAGVTLPNNLEYEEWVANIEKQTQHSLIHVLERLSRHSFVTTNYSDCQKWLHTLLEYDPFNEDYHIQLIKSLCATGNHDEAYKYGLMVQDHFLRDLNEPPSTEMTTLIKQLEKSRSIKLSTQNYEKIDRHDGDLPLIGQTDLLENLIHSYQTGGMVFLTGETGSGKSRITEELAHRVAPAPKLLKAVCHPQQRNIPFQPLVEMMRADFPKESFSNLPDEWKTGLSSIYPDLSLKQVKEQASEYKVKVDSQSVILEAIRSLVVREASADRLIILLDDAQWCDESTLTTFTYLLDHQVFPDCGLLIVTSNPSIQNLALSKFQSDLLNRHPDIVRCLTIPPLNIQSIKQLSLKLLERPVPAEMLKKIQLYSGGNPLFAIEALKSVIKSGERISRDLTNINISETPTIQTILKERFDSLSNISKSILYTAAILGVNIDQDLLEKASYHSPEEIVDVLEELETAHIIQIQKLPGQMKPQYTFTQHAFREAIIHNMSMPRLRLIHKRVAHALRDQSSGSMDKNASILAEHFEAGGEMEEAFEFWVAAGNYAKRMSSMDEEVRAYERAEKLLISTEMLLSDQQILNLFAPWISTAYMMHDISMLNRISRELLSLGKQRGSSILTGYGLYGLSDACFSQNDYKETIRYVDEALIYLSDVSYIPYQVKALARKGSALYMTNQFEAALRIFTQALDLTDQDQPEMEKARGHMNHQIAALHTFMGNPDLGYYHADLALKYFIQVGDLHGQVDSYSIKILSSFYSGKYELALNLSVFAIELAKRLKFWRMIGYTLVFSGYSHAVVGDLDSAWKCAEEAEEIAVTYKHPDLLSAADRLYGDIFRYLKNYETAAGYYRKGWESSENHFVGVDNLGRLGYQLCLLGQKEEGIQYIRQAHQSAYQMGLGTVMISTQLYEIDMLFVEIPGTFSMEKLEEIKQDCIERTLPSQQMVAMGLIAYRELRQDQPEIALNIFKEIVQMARDIGDPWTEIAGHLALLHTRNKIYPDQPNDMTRIHELIERIRSHTTLPNLQISLQNYIKSIDKMIA